MPKGTPLFAVATGIVKEAGELVRGKGCSHELIRLVLGHRLDDGRRLKPSIIT